MSIHVVRLGSARLEVECYCADESRCHRSVLRELLAARDTQFA